MVIIAEWFITKHLVNIYSWMKKLYVLVYTWAIFIIDKYGLPTEWLAILFVLLVVDIITGIHKSYEVHDWAKGWFSTRRLTRWALFKFILFVIATLMCISIAYLSNNSGIEIFAVSVVIWVLIIAELFSIIQNYLSAKIWDEVEEWDAITFVLQAVKDKLQKFLEDKLS